MNKVHKIAGIGEILWDVFPNGSRLGGAPVNFAIHSFQLGSEAFPVSSVGRDPLGAETRKAIRDRGLSDRFISTSAELPTGRVAVTLDQSAKPSYDIIENVAWDDLKYSSDLKELAPVLDAACFGVLGQRSAGSRETISRFLEDMSEESLKICDVNLRSPFFSKALVEGALQRANVLKLSDEELPVLAEYWNIEGDVSCQLEALREKFDLAYVAYTRGGEGSLIVSELQSDECLGYPTTPVDTVGAGDSFTAALVFGLLSQWPLKRVNSFANRVASFVCSQKGATPALPAELIQSANPPSTISTQQNQTN